MIFPYLCDKDWGYELWFANNQERDYCGKELGVRARFMCSVHAHREKDETFFVIAGKFLVETGSTGDALTAQVLQTGECLHIPTGLFHRFSALDDTLAYNKIIEVSTFHQDSDVIRHLVGGRRWSAEESLPRLP